MLVGTLATTYSGWFIAPSLAIMLSKKPSAGPVRAAAETAGVRVSADARRTDGKSETAAAGAMAGQPVRKSKSQRKARAT
jgi:hypothetical protein